MKRSLCVSAMLVGLSLTTASVAFAAPVSANAGTAAAAATEEGTAAKKPTLVAQAKPGTKPAQQQVQDPAPSGGTPAPADSTTPAAAPEAAPSAAPGAAEGTATPAISLGSASPASDTPQSSATETKKKPAMRRWAGTQVASYTSMTTATIFKGQNQYDNPTVDTSLWLLPRFAISESFQLRALLVFNYEFTNSDTTVTNNEPRFSDTNLGLWYRKIPEIPGVGIKPMVAVNLGLPTSPESRARTLVVNPGATLQLVKGFEHVLGGEITLIGSTVYSHPLYRYQTPGDQGRQLPYNPSCFGDATSCGGQLNGTFNPSDTFAYSLIVAGEWGKWSPAIMYRGTSQWAYTSSKDVAVLSNGQPVNVNPSQYSFTPQNVRQLSYFSFWLDYNANAWFTTEVGYWMSRALLDGDGQLGNPFFNRYQDMRVYLGFNFNIDNILKALEGGDADAGIVRAKNGKQPMWTF